LNVNGAPNGLIINKGNVRVDEGNVGSERRHQAQNGCHRNAAIDGGAATISTGGFTDTVTITGGNFDNLVPASAN